jgi:hypothetical protein
MSSIHIAGRENEKADSDRDAPSPEAMAVTTAQNEAQLTRRILFKTDTRLASMAVSTQISYWSSD